MSRPPPSHPSSGFRKQPTLNLPPPSERHPTPSSPHVGPPTAADIVASYARIPPRTKLYLAFGLLGFSSFGVFMTYKLEEWFPVQKRVGPGAGAGASDAKSRADILWEEEEKELERLENERTAAKVKR